MASVSLSDLSVELGRRSILDRISLDIGDGTFAAVVGPSGVGKSTVLRAIAGLVVPVSGSILFDGVDMTRVKPAARDVGMVFQTPALLPNRNVRRNVEFPLELRGETAETMRDRVTAEARAMHIEHLLRRDPAHLSRGEQQLVQIARTMVRSPKVLLLDEPFAPLDEHLRSAMRADSRVRSQEIASRRLRTACSGLSRGPAKRAARCSRVVARSRLGSARSRFRFSRASCRRASFSRSAIAKARSARESFMTCSICASASSSVGSRPICSTPLITAMVAGTAPCWRTMSSTLRAICRLPG